MVTHETGAARKRCESQTNVAKVRAGVPYVWDGKNEEERPLTQEEMQAGSASVDVKALIGGIWLFAV